jgi:SWI/SNF-related matrix-associated actin-dependent regulator of chromatin subfamily A-like protein 1
VPLKHQLEAIEFMQGMKNIPLFDEQGLGKSKIVIDTLCRDFENQLFESALIICKKTLLYTWGKEISKHSNLFTTILSGTKKRRSRTFSHFSHFYLINYEGVITELERIHNFLSIRKFAIVLDESQIIKNIDSKTTKAILSLKDLAVKKIIVTGTPIANKPIDLWTQFFFLDGGNTLGKDFESFKKNYHVDFKNDVGMKTYEGSLRDLKVKIESISIRRTKDILELPQKIYINEYVQLKYSQKAAYEMAKSELLIELKDIDGNKIIKEIDNYLVKLLRLTQIVSNPKLIDDSYDETPEKYKKLDTLVDSIINNGEKVIIWTSFRDNIRGLRKRYSRYGALMLYGDMLIEERNKSIEKFSDSIDNKVLIANPSAAKEGLTLTAANNAIYLDRSFKMDDYLQSQDRIHRLSQVKKCQIIKIIAKDTIDEYTDEIIEKKHALSKFILGDTKGIEINQQHLTKEDLLRILG